MSRDHDDDHRAAMQDLYNRVLDTDVTPLATSWLFRAHMLAEIAGEDIDAAKAVIHLPEGLEASNREYEALDEQQRAAALAFVGAHWTRCVLNAIARLWHACEVLQIDPKTLNAEHVALHAATLLGDTPVDAGDDGA